MIQNTGELITNWHPNITVIFGISVIVLTAIVLYIMRDLFRYDKDVKRVLGILIGLFKQKKSVKSLELFKQKPKIYCRRMNMRINVCRLTSCQFYGKC